MATYKDLQDRIALDYLNRFDLIPATKRAIQNAIRCYEVQRFWFNETATTTTTTANTSSFGVPSDFIALDRIELLYSSARYDLLPRTFGEIRDMNITSVTGVPTHFNYRGDRFELAIIPDSAYSVTTYYLQTLPTLSADSDSNAWTNEASNLIVHAAVVDLLAGVIQDVDQARIDRHIGLAQMSLKELKSRNDIRLIGRLNATQF